MAVTVFKTFSAGEVLTASDLNSSFTRIIDNQDSLGWPATSSKDFDGNELILDSDGDTSITADTDDQIDIRLAGADDFQFTANTFTVLTGSKIDLNGTELILDADADTSITADSDDQIDIAIAGADDFQFTANTFTALSGSKILVGANDGVHLTEGTAPSTAANVGALYTKDTGGQPELFYREESSGDEVQMTSGGTLNALVSGDIGSTVQGFDADTLKADTADVLTAGFATTPYNAGTKSSGTYTPDEANGNFQYAVNGGAHTLAPMSNDGSVCIQYTNNASAGTITTSGFTVVDGDVLTTTDGDDFFFFLTVNNGFSSLTVQALQ